MQEKASPTGLLAWICKLPQRWRDWFGDKELEQDIRNHLNRTGFYGRSAKFSNCHLVAIQRPGWVQIHSFNLQARLAVVDENRDGDDEPRPPEFRHPPAQQFENSGEDSWVPLYGLAKDDGRTKSVVVVFQTPRERHAQFQTWTDASNFIVKRRVDWSG